MDPTAITIAIPFYGQQEYLLAAVESVRAQSTPDWQLIVCDNASPETGGARMSSVWSDPRIRYLRNAANVGMAGNFNQCLDMAGTDLVTLLHHDDRLLPDYCQSVLRAAQKHPRAVGFFCPAEIIDSRGKACFSLPDFVKRLLSPRGNGSELVLQGESAVTALLRANFIVGPSVCFRKSILHGRRFAMWRQVLDTDLHFRLLLEGEKLVGLPSRNYAYRRHEGQTTARNIETLKFFVEESMLYERVAAAAAARGWRRAERLARHKRMIKLHLGYRILADLMCFRLRPVRAKVELLMKLQRGQPLE